MGEKSKHKSVIKIALDTSCLNVKREHSILNKLENLKGELKIELVTSTVNEREQIETNHNEKWRKVYLKKINEGHKVFETGISEKSISGSCVCTDENVSNTLRGIFGKKNIIDNDEWLLETAVIHECDYFLTLNSKHFIENGRKEQIEKLGIKVRVPNDDFLRELESVHKPILNEDFRKIEYEQMREDVRHANTMITTIFTIGVGLLAAITTALVGITKLDGGISFRLNTLTILLWLLGYCVIVFVTGMFYVIMNSIKKIRKKIIDYYPDTVLDEIGTVYKKIEWWLSIFIISFMIVWMVGGTIALIFLYLL